MRGRRVSLERPSESWILEDGRHGLAAVWHYRHAGVPRRSGPGSDPTEG